MGTLFRSEDMSMCQLYLQAEAAYACTSELGELGVVQFRDLNEHVNAFQRQFVSQIRRCDEMERQLRYFEKEIKKEGVEIKKAEDNPSAPAPRDIVDLEATFERREGELKEISNNSEVLRRNFVELTELKYVLQSAQEFFQDTLGATIVEDAQEMFAARAEFESSDTKELTTEPTATRQNLGFVSGVIPREKLVSFTRLLWFACRGNVFIRHHDIDEEIEDIASGDMIRKSVFTVFFQGSVLQAKVKKICEGYKATLYPCPEDAQERREMSLGVIGRLEELKMVLETSNSQKKRILGAIAENIQTWYIKVQKIKAIYHVMDMYAMEQKGYVAECYVPVADLERVKMALDKATEITGTSAPSICNQVEATELPTYYRTNKFTKAFQTIIDAYGCARYKEVNPAPFSIITFPFLFSVMFGDTGHGIIMFLAALFLVIKERQYMKNKTDNEIWNIFFGGRYLILLMGAFSIYSGLMYNDVFSKSINIFGSSWKGNYDDRTIMTEHQLMLDPNSTSYAGEPYPVGLDPVWQLAKNKISFTNSLKKKLSVIFGVAQMVFGIILSTFNHSYNKRPLDIVCGFLPELIFLMCLFGYLDMLIFVKWIKFAADNASCAPSLLIGLINMFLFKYPTKEEAVCNVRAWYPGQQGFQTFLVITAVICVPWMLAVKPLILRSQYRRRALAALVNKKGIVLDPETGTASSSTDDHAATDDVILVPNGSQGAATVLPKEEVIEEFDFGDVFMHQAIHTIEFCLGCISHTASYLRLWALSLAHAQLSEVLWSMVFRIGLSMPGYAGAFVTFATFTPWALLTLAILLFMEGLSAFLHTLRLHWVEFMSKFYKGEGFVFTPFNFEEILGRQGTSSE